MLSTPHLKCFSISQTEISCNGTVFERSHTVHYKNVLFWIYLSVYCSLVVFAGICSGLTLGLLSLSELNLRIIEDGGSKSHKKYARALLPLIKRKHLLLVSLLLANAIAVESMPIFLNQITHEIVAIAVSVTAVLFFGEVLPQALCSRYGLAIGYYLSPFVWIIIISLFLIAYPISKILDHFIGKDEKYYNRDELSALVELHSRSSPSDSEPLSRDESQIIKGALLLGSKDASQIFTKLDDAFMIDYYSKYNDKIFNQLLLNGGSHVPIFKKTRSNILGVIAMKTLLALETSRGLSIADIFKEFGELIPEVEIHLPLYELLGILQKNRNHQAIVFDNDKKNSIVGLVTLEDVMAELIQNDITLSSNNSSCRKQCLNSADFSITDTKTFSIQEIKEKHCSIYNSYCSIKNDYPLRSFKESMNEVTPLIHTKLR